VFRNPASPSRNRPAIEDKEKNETQNCVYITTIIKMEIMLKSFKIKHCVCEKHKSFRILKITFSSVISFAEREREREKKINKELTKTD
jgi:hypothetical protein